MIILSLGKREYVPQGIKMTFPREEKIISLGKNKESPCKSDHKTLFEEEKILFLRDWKDSPLGRERLSPGKNDRTHFRGLKKLPPESVKCFLKKVSSLSLGRRPREEIILSPRKWFKCYPRDFHLVRSSRRKQVQLPKNKVCELFGECGKALGCFQASPSHSTS